MLKKIFCLSALLLFTASVYGQINIGSVKTPDARSGAGELRSSEVRKLQRGRTIFFYGEKDKPYLEEYKNVAQQVWKAGTLEFDDIANLKQYERARNTAFITLEVNPVYKINRNIGKETEVDCQVYYHLWMPQGSRETNTYARIDLFTEAPVLQEVIKLKNEQAKKDYLYTRGAFYNWNPGFMKLYFKHLSNRLSTDDDVKTVALYEDFANTDSVGLKALQNAVLYAPQYILAEKDPVSRKVSYRPAIDLFEKYPFTYEIMKTNELSQMITEDEDGEKHIFIYTQSGPDKHFCVYKTNGELLFHEYEGNSFNLEDGDLKELGNIVEK